MDENGEMGKKCRYFNSTHIFGQLNSGNPIYFFYFVILKLFFINNGIMLTELKHAVLCYPNLIFLAYFLCDFK